MFRELPKTPKVKVGSVRKAGKKDVKAIKNLYRNTILTVNKNDYSPEQLKYWCDKGKDVNVWEEQIGDQHFILAERQGKVTGFAAITPEGYLHSLFVHKDLQQQGIASMLLESIEKYARRNKIKQVITEVSITARPFFEKKGYATLAEQSVYMGIDMTSYRMTKEIPGKEE
ncbi:MAG: GNAT family N-acetyltransferase [Bacteroidales bacterium]|nr:GNAT family N-acetyltransferase [Bacteroidales bacterium]